jgi:hypothetical protein
MRKQDDFRPGDIFAEIGSPLTWPLPWPARLIIAVDGKGDVRLPGGFGIETLSSVAIGDIFWTDTYGTGLCSKHTFDRRNDKYGLVRIGNLLDA